MQNKVTEKLGTEQLHLQINNADCTNGAYKSLLEAYPYLDWDQW